MVLPSGIDSTDFVTNPIADIGRTVSRTPITKTEDNISGREALAEGTPVNITADFFRRERGWSWDKEGKIEGGDAFLYVGPLVTLNEQDLITVDGITYEVRNLITIKAASTAMYKYANLFIKS